MDGWAVHPPAAVRGCAVPRPRAPHCWRTQGCGQAPDRFPSLGRDFFPSCLGFLRLVCIVSPARMTIPQPAGTKEAGRNGAKQMSVRVLLVASVSAAFVFESGQACAQDKDKGSYTTELPAVEVAAPTAARQ